MEVGLTKEQLESHQRTAVERAQRYRELVGQLTVLGEGPHEIEVQEIVWKDLFMYDGVDQDIIIRDTQGQLIRLNEELLKMSRHDVKPGMRLKITIAPVEPAPPTHIVACEVLH